MDPIDPIDPMDSGEARDIIVTGGPERPERPERTPRQWNVDRIILQLILVAVLLVAAATAFTGWQVRRQGQVDADFNCAVFLSGGTSEFSYDDLPKSIQKLVDELDCDVKGR